eukprot:SAG31_NODE_32067_length_360_cov_0.992337_1_plen_28_part_10
MASERFRQHMMHACMHARVLVQSDEVTR